MRTLPAFPLDAAQAVAAAEPNAVTRAASLFGAVTLSKDAARPSRAALQDHGDPVCYRSIRLGR